MKVLFDHNVPRKLASRLLPTEVVRAAELGWEVLKNGELLKAAEGHGFDVMVTADKNLSYQQNLKGRKIAIIVLPTNNLKVLEGKASELLAALEKATPSSFQTLG